MRKLRLDVEELAVESFETLEERAERGTVLGHARTYAWEYSCDENNTCAQMMTCGANASCAYTCNNADTCGGEYSCDINCPGVVIGHFGGGTGGGGFQP